MKVQCFREFEVYKKAFDLQQMIRDADTWCSR